MTSYLSFALRNRCCARAAVAQPEAWKNPSRHDYYFGHLDADRVAFTMGRDLALKPQRGALLNYLIYPYAELDGAPIAQDKIKSSFAYHDVSPGK